MFVDGLLWMCMMLVMQNMKLIQVLVPPIVKRRIERFAKNSGLAMSPWVRQFLMVVTQDTDAAKQLRSLVAQSLMVRGKE